MGDGFFIAVVFVVIAAVGGFFLGQESVTPPTPNAQMEQIILHQARTDAQWRAQYEKQEQKILSEIQQEAVAHGQ